ncbi:MAG: DUF5348 domain-containing protein [Oscillospiraceae bacterium]|nr:DUF5348 domain-containing protein [Oscillospiraceae bacterium]
MPKKEKIIRAIDKINNRAARVRTLAEQISAMSEETLGNFDSATFSLNLEIATRALETVLETAAYLSRPIVETSRLWKNGSGQYETTSGYCFREGSDIEALVPDMFNPDIKHWERTCLKHDGKDYRLVGYPEVSLAGLTVRVRMGDKP